MESKNYDFKQLNNKNYQFYSKEDALKLINGRDIYVWAASFRGIGFAKALKREGMQVKAFLDSSPLLYDKEYDGIPVLRPDIIFKNANFLKNCFIFVASTGYSMQEIYKMCENAGLKKSKDFLNYQALSPFSPCIEISGICTLKCVTCPRGTHDKPFPNGKFMTAETYSKIIEKMINEIPFMSFVDLYVWGDPMLNPELPEIIKINKSLGITTALSTNLNVTKNLEYVIKASPEHIRVSISGVGEKYEITHTGGEWEKLYKNLLLLSEYQAKHKSDSIVEIYFHVYKHNIEDVKTLKNFCKQHNFHFKYVCAMFFPDIALNYCKGIGLSSEASRINDLLIYNLDTLIENARKEKNKSCLLKRVLPVINWDNSVIVCCNYSPRIIIEDYLKCSIKDIVERRDNHTLCKECQEYSIHRYFVPQNYTEHIKKLLNE